MNHPYHDLPATAFWRKAVADPRPEAISDLWDPKYPIKQPDRIATFGSCFAQHISRSLVEQNYNWFDAEVPDPEQRFEASRDRGYGIFSARTGNIYTAAALRQWVEWATAETAPPDEVWEKDGRYFDPFRPTVEPSGFSSPAELFASREATLRALREVISGSDHFVFTLGLTEAWISRQGYTYAACPGTTGVGQFNPKDHFFKNFDYSEILADMLAVGKALRLANASVKVLLTVSPVPLTATASGKHILVATVHSKSVLRAVAGYLSDSQPWIDYFPSYEIIAGAPSRARFYEPNLRTVTPDGVRFVMRSFFDCLNKKFGPAETAPLSVEPAQGGRPAHDKARTTNLRVRPSAAAAEDVVCEEIMLDAFAPASNALSNLPIEVDPDAKKICIIGNSHVAALRGALDEKVFVDRKMDIVFWGFAGQSYFEIKFEGGVFIHPNTQRALATSNGRFASIDPKAFDVLVFVGAGLKPGNLLVGLKEQTKRNAAALEEALRRILKRPAMDLVISAARDNFGKIVFVPAPLISELSGEKADAKVSGEVYEQFNRVLTKIFAEIGISYLAQPLETVRDQKWTKREYSREDNFVHMNEKYGVLILDGIRDRVRAITGEAAARQSGPQRRDGRTAAWP